MMRPQIVLFGDSITQVSFDVGGWGAALANTYARKVDIMNRGYAGYNTAWGLIMLQHLFLLDAPMPIAGITLFFGANDAALLGRISETKHVPIDEFKENLRKMTQHMKKYSPSVEIVMICQPPIDDAGRVERERSQGKMIDVPERTNEEAGKYARKCVELAEELCVRSINLWSIMQETEGWEKKFLSDGLHLTPAGSAVVYQEVMKAFNETSLSAEKLPLFDGASKFIGQNNATAPAPAPAPGQ